MRTLIRLARRWRRQRRPDGPVTVTRLPGPEQAPAAPPAYRVRPGLPVLPPDITRQDEQHIRCRLRHLTGEE
jgi:hypothetical protein